MKRKPIPRMASVAKLIDLALEGADGRHWYKDAAVHVRGAAFILDCDAQRLADILALLSPRVSVKRNIRFALRYVKDGKFAGDVMRTIRASVNHYELTGEIRGPKTGPFARAIMGDLNAIVLDVWMAVAFGIDQKRFSVKRVHAECSKRIRAVAKNLGWKNAEVQAAIWYAAVRRADRHPSPYVLVEKNLFGTHLVESA